MKIPLPLHSPRHALRVLALLGTVSLLPNAAQAQGPIGGIISYQGQLSDNAGKPVADGTQNLTFKIYEDGTEVSSQTMSVATVGGVFNTFLSVGALSFDPAKSYELGITAGGKPEVKHPIAAVPVAVSAKKAESAATVQAPLSLSGNEASSVLGVSNTGTGPAIDTNGRINTNAAYHIGNEQVLGKTPGGNGSFAVGTRAGLNNTGDNSLFVGYNAGRETTTGNGNTLVGTSAGISNTTGEGNTFVGNEAGYNNTTGSNNTAIGFHAGTNLNGNNNILIGHGGGIENDTIRIGEAQTRAFMAGINGTTGLTTPSPVVVDSAGQLGTAGEVYDSTKVVQLAPSTQQTVSSSNAGINIRYGNGASPIYFARFSLSNANITGASQTRNDQIALFADGGLLAQGELGYGTIPKSGTGSRMMWYPFRSSFRAGRIDNGGTQWDDANMGFYSFATGYNTMASGIHSFAAGSGSVASNSAAVALGYNSTASGQYTAALGRQNTASGDYSTALGYNNTVSGDFSTVLGRGAQATHDYSFVLGLTPAIGAVTTASDRDGQFKVRAPGGATFLSNNATNNPTGVELAAGAGTWSNLSDRNSKKGFAPINTREVLRKVSNLPLSSWQYKENPSRHIGPMAQDFRAAFGLGMDERHIDSVDIDGVALAAIQGLNAEIKDRDAKIEALEAKNAAQDVKNAALEARLKRLEGALQNR